MRKLILIGFAITALFSCSKEETKTAIYSNPLDTTYNGDTTIYKRIIEIKTSFGDMYMWLYPETPLHRANFLKLAATDFFDNTTFHRCVDNFVIQGGDPNSKDSDSTNDGSGGPGYTIPAEIKASNPKLTHTFGAVGAARLGDASNPLKASSGSQFYIVVPTAGTSFLNANYTVFGRIIKGMDVANTIEKQAKNSNARPYIDIKMDVNVLNKTLAEIQAEYNFVP